MINKFFIPNYQENKLIKTIQKYNRNDFTLIRMTRTMLSKSIIDASTPIRNIFKNINLFDYDEAIQGTIYTLKGTIATNTIKEHTISAYRPKTKNGDPRFWIKDNFKKLVNIGDLIYISTYNSKLVIIPLTSDCFCEDTLAKLFYKDNDDNIIIKELISKLSEVKKKGYIESVSPNKLNDKDVGETLEKALGLKINNLVTADYKGKIEIKAKREKAKTDDTLFCKIPDWEISKEKSVKDIILKYGYPDREYENCTSLFVTITTNPNAQGLYLDVDYEKEILYLNHISSKSTVSEVGCWYFATLKKSLLKKHPKTAWIKAKHKRIDSKIHFKYTYVELTQDPIFSQFLSLIEQNIIVFELRSSYYSSGDKIGKNRTDNGQAFRLDPKHRSDLFGELKSIDI